MAKLRLPASNGLQAKLHLSHELLVKKRP